jgi:hypothetical protein
VSRNNKGSLVLSLRLSAPETPADLADVAATWPTLPEPGRAGIVAMVRASEPPAP